MPTRVSRLCPVPPVMWGVRKLKRDIAEQERVFCICSIARDYHVGAKGGADLLARATGEERLVPRDRDDVGAETVYVPTTPPAHVNGALARAEAHVRDDLERAYRVLHTAYPEYRRGCRLADQPDATIRRRIEAAFEELQRAEILPITTGGPVFNHQGLVLIMAPCFSTEDELVDYLRDPVLS